MFNKAWIQLAILLVAMGLLLDVPALLVLAAFLLTVVPLGWWWSRRSLDRVRYERVFGARRVFSGETVDLSLHVTNEKLLPLSWLTVDDRWSMALPLEGAVLFHSPTDQMGHFRCAFAVRWFERIRRRHRLRCTRRGFYPFGPAQLRSGDLFGLFRRTERRDELDWLIVYPQVLPLEALGFPPKQPFGETKANWRIFEDPSRAVGVRDHRPEDGFRHIHWKATARKQDLQVKVYEPTTSHNLVIFLNVATFAKQWQGTIPSLLERAISVAASIVQHAIEARYVVGLVANGSIPHSDQPIKVLPSRSPDQLSRLLEALAAVTSFASSSIEALLLSESPRLPWGATLVVVSAIVTDDLLATLVRLREVGRRVVLVSLEGASALPFESPPGILTYRLDADDLPFDEAYLGEPEAWASDVAPPLRLAGGRR